MAWRSAAHAGWDPTTKMNHSALLRLTALLLLTAPGTASCSSVGATGQVGYTIMEIGGDLALDSGGGPAASVEQSVDTAFGLGDAQGSPYFRGQLDASGPVFTGSVFWLRDSGAGQLDGAFGGLPSGTAVEGDLDLGVAKISAAYDFDLWLVKVAPGLMCDVFALDFTAREQTLGGTEAIDEVVYVPMPFVRAEAGFGPVTAVGEIGFLEVSDLGDASGRFLDFEALVEVNIAPLAHLFAGYRLIDMDGDGDTGNDVYGVDLQLRGWTIGGGLRF